MANTVITNDIIANEALLLLKNNLVMPNLVFRGYEEEFGNQVNGYKQGSSVTIRRPAEFTVRSGATASTQDVVEGTTSITVDRQRGIDFKFTSTQLTLSIGELSERVIKPAMIQLAQQVDSDILSMYSSVANWSGTPGQTINSFSDFNKGNTLLNDFAVPMMDRFAILSPTDHDGMLGSQTALYVQDAAKDAYRNGRLGMVGGCDTYMSQNVAMHTVGVATGTPLVNGANQNVTYAASKDTWTQSLVTDGWTASTTGILKAGDVFTIAGVYAVNPRSKATLPRLRQFVVTADANSGASTGPATLTISPPIITSGAFQTCSAAPADDAPITVVGTGGTSYAQNIVAHKNALAFVSVPMELPAGAVNPTRKRDKDTGLSVRLVPYYDGSNDESNWRLDILYGVKCLDPRLITRLSGTA